MDKRSAHFDPEEAVRILERDMGAAIRVLTVLRDLELDEGNEAGARVYADVLELLIG